MPNATTLHRPKCDNVRCEWCERGRIGGHPAHTDHGWWAGYEWLELDLEEVACLLLLVVLVVVAPQGLPLILITFSTFSLGLGFYMLHFSMLSY